MSTIIDDRIERLLPLTSVTGIDFIYVYPGQKILDIYFLNNVDNILPVFPGSLTPEKITISSPQSELPEIKVKQVMETLVGGVITWPRVNGQTVLRLETETNGDFSLYNLKINDPRIDPYFNDVSFSFKANCPSDLDCKPAEHECPPGELIDFPIDYLARDFWSYRKALIDFASLKYPSWPDRLEADAGVMLAEMMSAIGDEMAYYQDRINREAYLETATQRRSLRTHAHLIDYYMHDGRGAKTWLEITVDDTFVGDIDIVPGTLAYACADDNSVISFETGNSIRETMLPVPPVFKVNKNKNKFNPHIWDNDDTCLAANSTALYLDGDQSTILDKGKWVLIQTLPTDPAQPARAQMVKLTKVQKLVDPVFGGDITLIEWGIEQALKFEFDLTILKVKGNMLPATAGKKHTAYFTVDKSPDTLSDIEFAALEVSEQGSTIRYIEQTIERRGIGESIIHLSTLPQSESMQLVYLGEDLQKARPEIVLEEIRFIGGAWVPVEQWECKQTLVGINSSGPSDPHFVLDDGSWRRVVSYQRLGGEFIHKDYASNEGVTVRFGDGKFGKKPNSGSIFRVSYRLGGGTEANVAAGTIKYPVTNNISFNNPLAAIDGLNRETASELRQLAPQQFRSITYRAVRPEDYAEAAERLPWVQKAGASFRWTGSWLTAFVTPDPKGKVTIDGIQRTKLQEQLNRFRQAGREVYVSDPEYANIDLEIHVCVLSSAYPGTVKQRVFEALLGTKGFYPKQGYFSPDRFTFGTLLDRSTLEAAIQEVPGVKAVELIRFRRRSWFDWSDFTQLSYDPGKNVIIRIANDPLHPERGTIKLYTHGGL